MIQKRKKNISGKKFSEKINEMRIETFVLGVLTQENIKDFSEKISELEKIWAMSPLLKERSDETQLRRVRVSYHNGKINYEVQDLTEGGSEIIKTEYFNSARLNKN